MEPETGKEGPLNPLSQVRGALIAFATASRPLGTRGRGPRSRNFSKTRRPAKNPPCSANC